MCYKKCYTYGGVCYMFATLCYKIWVICYKLLEKCYKWAVRYNKFRYEKGKGIADTFWSSLYTQHDRYGPQKSKTLTYIRLYIRYACAGQGYQH